MSNLMRAYKESRKGKSNKPGVRMVDANPIPFLKEVQRLLITKEYRSGTYRGFIVHERNKDREVFDIDYFPHRIVHWALMLVIRPILMDYIGDHSYAAMQGRGSHQALSKLKQYLRKDPEGTRYCFKMDVKKYFPSIIQEILIRKLERKIKDPDVMWLCKEIIYGYEGPGLPIGNYTSQYFANYYLADVDRYMKQKWHCHYYLRYMDDIIVLGSSKSWLHRVQRKMESLLKENGLTMKPNWQIFQVEDRGVDFVGYRTFHHLCIVRKQTKYRIKKVCRRLSVKINEGRGLDVHDVGSMVSYKGVLMWCNGFRLAKLTILDILEKGGMNERTDWTYLDG